MSESLDGQIALAKALRRKFFTRIAIAIVFFLVVVSALVGLTQLLGEKDNSPNVETTPKELPAPVPLTSEQRQILQQLLSETNQTITHIINNTDKVNWATDTSQALASNMEQAYVSYAQGAFEQTKQTIDKLNDEAQDFNRDYQLAYEGAYQQAFTAFTAGDINQAEEANRVALTINSSFDQALALQKRINVFAEVQALREQGRIAEVENNLDKSQLVYQTLVALDSTPERLAKLSELNKKIQTRQFSEAIAIAIKARDKGELVQAQKALDTAKRIDGSRPELASVQKTIAQLIAANAEYQAKQHILAFVGADEWPTVELLTRKALTEYPDNSHFQGLLDSALRISDTNKKLDNYIQRPERLSDPRIALGARDVIADSQTLFDLSPNLGQKIHALEGLLDTQNHPLKVVVKSDKRTFISVLGVGQVGKVTEKTILLAPGRYQFEGKCTGFHTVLQTVVISVDKPIPEVEIVCTEAIN